VLEWVGKIKWRSVGEAAQIFAPFVASLGTLASEHAESWPTNQNFVNRLAPGSEGVTHSWSRTKEFRWYEGSWFPGQMVKVTG